MLALDYLGFFFIQLLQFFLYEEKKENVVDIVTVCKILYFFRLIFFNIVLYRWEICRAPNYSRVAKFKKKNTQKKELYFSIIKLLTGILEMVIIGWLNKFIT